MKTVIVFVLGSSGAPYPQLMHASRETWDSTQVDGVPTWYFTNPVRDEPPRTIQLQGGGDLCDMGHKCLAAYRWALDSLTWDYMARVNASCYARKSLLLDYVQVLPAKGLMRGLLVKDVHGTDFLLGGGQFIMSRDVVQAIVDNGRRWQHDHAEDVAVSILAREIGISLDDGGRACAINPTPNGWQCIAFNGSPGFDFTDFQEFKEKAGDQFFIRVKQDADRNKDIWIMRKLWSLGLC